MLKTLAFNLGPVLLISTLGTELAAVLFDLRYIALFIAALLIMDFWFGKSESSMRYKAAEARHDTAAMILYEFHLSRATRRTAVKAVDYTGVLALFVLAGLILEQCKIGVTHVQMAAISLIWAACAEGWSILTHILVLRGHHIDRSSLGTTLRSVARAVAVSWIRSKSESLGNAVDKALDGLPQSTGGDDKDD